MCDIRIRNSIKLNHVNSLNQIYCVSMTKTLEKKTKTILFSSNIKSYDFERLKKQKQLIF